MQHLRRLSRCLSEKYRVSSTLNLPPKMGKLIYNGAANCRIGVGFDQQCCLVTSSCKYTYVESKPPITSCCEHQQQQRYLPRIHDAPTRKVASVPLSQVDIHLSCSLASA
eukprot:3393522-Amphidinium_carterae.1